MNTRTFFGVVLWLSAALFVAGCDSTFGDGVRGSGNVVTEGRDVSGFDEIVVLGSGSVVVTVTGTESLTIEAEDNIMPLLTAEVRNRRLELGSESSFSTTGGITFTITAAALSGIEIDGSGDVSASGIDVDSFEATINGSGNVVANGTSRELNVGINGSGNFNGEGLEAAIGRVEVSGSGNAVVNVTDELAAVVSGSGSVEYFGDPTLDESISGSGGVSRR